MAPVPKSKMLIVGVDYGTTFSGISFVFSDKTSVEDIEVLDQWDSSYAYQKQVPSRIAYQPNLAWGYGIEPNQVAYCWTKLLLDRKVALTEHDDERLRSIYGEGYKSTATGKTAEDIVTDYLTLLYKHMMTELERKISKPILEVTPISFWFTYPALWSVRAQEATRKAATKAGFGSRRDDEIHLIKEPEAAAIACLSAQASSGPHPLIKTGTAVLVCDAGGGTVDLASYKIVLDTPTLKMDQACVSEGGKCGSTSIDRAFTELMETRFGDAFTDVPAYKKGVNSRFMKDFESAKHDFADPRISRTHRFRLKMDSPYSEFYDDEDDEVIFTSADMKSIFDPVVDKIEALIEEQVGSTLKQGLEVKTIVLVGGFGESRYLYNRIYKQWSAKGIVTFNPPKSWEAVCLGAAFRGLKGEVVECKRSRSNIGYSTTREFRPEVDSESVAWTSPFSGIKYAIDYMDWPIKRGNVITPETAKRRSRRLAMDSNEPQSFYVILYESRSHLAPEKEDDFSITQIGKIHVTLDQLDYDQFESKPTSKGKAYRIFYDIVMIPEDDLGYMHFRVESQGKIVGQARLKFDGEE